MVKSVGSAAVVVAMESARRKKGKAVSCFCSGVTPVSERNRVRCAVSKSLLKALAAFGFIEVRGLRQLEN